MGRGRGIGEGELGRCSARQAAAIQRWNSWLHLPASWRDLDSGGNWENTGTTNSWGHTGEMPSKAWVGGVEERVQVCNLGELQLHNQISLEQNVLGWNGIGMVLVDMGTALSQCVGLPSVSHWHFMMLLLAQQSLAWLGNIAQASLGTSGAD